MKKIVCHPRLGEITLSRTLRASRITLSVRPDGSIRLSFPALVSERRALRFLEQKVEWAEQVRTKQKAQNPVVSLADSFPTRRHRLRLLAGDYVRISVRITEEEIIVRYPHSCSADSEQVQEAARRGVVEALRREAKELLPPWVDRLATRHGFRYRNIAIKATHSKWGSCTAHNDLNFSLFLLLLPDELIEYVILHELCHTVHKNHSPRFHALLDEVTNGRDRELAREMRKRHPSI